MHQTISRSTRHTFTSRLLFTCISSHLYYREWTLDDLHGELALQAIDAYESGICDAKIEFIFLKWPLFAPNPMKSTKCSSQRGLQGCQRFEAAPDMHRHKGRLGVSEKGISPILFWRMVLLVPGKKYPKYLH